MRGCAGGSGMLEEAQQLHNSLYFYLETAEEWKLRGIHFKAFRANICLCISLSVAF